jgi:hypothetical protein
VRQVESVIDFGKVIFGESKKQFYKLINEGALKNTIVFKGKSGEDIMGLDMSASVNSSRNYSLEKSGNNEVDSQLRD